MNIAQKGLGLVKGAAMTEIFSIQYARWSDPSQGKGNTKVRQFGKMAEEAVKEGYTCKLEIFDDGRSAFDGHHVERGELGSSLKPSWTSPGTSWTCPSVRQLPLHQKDAVSRTRGRVWPCHPQSLRLSGGSNVINADIEAGV